MFWLKLRNFTNLNQPVKYEYEEDKENGEGDRIFSQLEPLELTTSGKPIAEVVVIEPRGFDEMPQVIQLLWKRKFVLLNLMMMDPQEAQRAVDFVAGGTYAIDGHQERVGDRIFLFTPTCVLVTTGLKCSTCKVSRDGHLPPR